MLITLVLLLHNIYMYQNITLYHIDMYIYYFSIKNKIKQKQNCGMQGKQCLEKNLEKCLY